MLVPAEENAWAGRAADVLAFGRAEDHAGTKITKATVVKSVVDRYDERGLACSDYPFRQVQSLRLPNDDIEMCSQEQHWPSRAGFIMCGEPPANYAANLPSRNGEVHERELIVVIELWNALHEAFIL